MRACVALLFCASCVVEGERVDGGCPSGETCSPETPEGLFFLGPALGDRPTGRGQPLATGVGGTQSIRVVTGEAANSPPFAKAFDAASSGSALGIGQVAAPDVQVQGLVAGQAFLRIVEPGTGLLFDRVAIDVKPVARMEVLPRSAILDEDFMDGGVAWALLAGGTDSAIVRLFASDQARIADESLSLGVTGGGFLAGAREGWDTLRLTGNAVPSGTLVVRTGDGRRSDAEIPVVAAVQEISSVAAIGGADSTNEPQPSTSAALFCFRATAGSLLVAGATWSYEGSAGLTITSLGSCASVRSELPAAGLITVAASGVIRDFAVSFAR